MKANMNKANFWDNIYEAYPKAVQEFYDFIDAYKKENNWDNLFKEGIKFHDIPIEMQFGIWLEFNFGLGCGNFEITLESDCFEIENLYEWANEWFRDREVNIRIETNT